jgi:hypothetical protein
MQIFVIARRQRSRGDPERRHFHDMLDYRAGLRPPRNDDIALRARVSSMRHAWKDFSG